jgi:two-component system sensor histidine kinase HydH
MKKFIPVPLTRTHLYLFIILAAATAVTMAGSFVTYGNARSFAEDSLKLQTLGIAVSLDAALKDSGPTIRHKGKDNIFTNIITGGRWQGIAFLALYDRHRLTLLHSNENLIGRKIEDLSIRKALETSEPAYEYIALGTGESVFVLNFPVHGPQGDLALRIALHTYPAEGIIRHAKLLVTGMFFVLLIVWSVGYFFAVAVSRSEYLKIKMAEKERLAVLGEMSSVLAHEIRNPLGSIKGFAQYLLEADQTAKGHAHKEYLDIIISEATRLETLTEHLLLYAKPMETLSSRFRLKGLVDETVQTFLQLGSGVSIGVFIQEDLEVIADRDKLRQALINIIRNSMDALDNDGKIVIKAVRKGDRAEVTVMDNGAGMDEQTVGKAFNPFFTTRTRGTGLGLAIVLKLVTAMAGTVSIESSLGKGTVFRLTIPAP